MTTENNAQDQLIKAKSDALRLLSVKARSVEEMKSRLKLKKHAPDVIDEVIGTLKKQNFLNDAEYAKLYANSRVSARPTGRKSLARDLERKGLTKDVVAAAIQGLVEYDEKKAARDLIAGKFQKMKGIDKQKKRMRLFGFLQRRGFDTNTIFAVIAELFKEDEVLE